MSQPTPPELDGGESFQPHFVIVDDQPALWRLDRGELAVAVFIDAQRADAYGADVYQPGSWRVASPSPADAVRLLTACHRAGVRIAVLNPTSSATRLFDIAAILRQVRHQLRRGEPLRF